MEPNWLNAREDRAWRAFVYAHQQIEVHLNRRLQESGLSGADYEVLALLSDHDGDSMPARELRRSSEGCLPCSVALSRTVSFTVRDRGPDGVPAGVHFRQFA